MRLPDALRARLRGPVTRLRGFRGHLDGEIGGALVGWVQPSGQARDVQVGLFAGGALLMQATANVYRGDLAAQGIGDGFAGFVLPLSEEIREMVAANGGTAEVRVIGPRAFLLGRWQAGQADTDTGTIAAPARTTALQNRLYGDLQRLARRMPEDSRLPAGPRPVSPVQALLFGPQGPLGGADLAPPMFAYAEFLRHRNRLDSCFDPARDPADVAHFFKHYLGVYGPSRAGLRTPLSRAAIDWLNAPVVIGGQEHSLSRAAWAFLMDRAELRQDMDFNDPDWHARAVYWWAVHQAPALGCEDCLVPADHVALLASVPEDTADPAEAADDWPLSRFMLRFRAETPELAQLPVETAEGRRDLTCALMILALTRPDILRYLPEGAQGAALEGGDNSPLAGFCAAMGQPLPGLDRRSYDNALRQQGFDPARKTFLSLTAEGHRAECARLPAIPRQAPVDVQVIGPFRKASGLGQATRLSAGVLERTGHSLNMTDFDLDNPAPKGFSSRAEVSDYRPARVNLFHLNAEAIPLAAAYQPDIFSGAYNIGYFYWELDSPATCHALGMEMLDEIWVSTEFGVSMFQPHTDKPVINVGMTFEELPEIPRSEARATLAARTGAAPEDFVFLVTFDCFSFVQRKNPLAVLAAFGAAFPGVRDVRLVIKTQNRHKVSDPGQTAIWQEVDAIVARDSRIILIDETLQYDELLRLKKGSDTYLSLHRSEGWGFGMIEAMNLGVPVLATGYSGNMDFCAPDTCWLVDYSLTEVGPKEYIFVRPGQHWADPDIEDAARQMRALYGSPQERAARTARAAERVRREFSHDAIAARYAARLKQILDAPARGQRAGS